MFRPFFAVLLCLVAVSLCRAAADEAELFVSPSGNDAWSGTLPAPNAERTDGPVATIHQAQKVVRDLKGVATRPAGPIVVRIRGGEYRLKRPILFTPDDSGTAESPVRYEAYPGEHPVFSGGVRLTHWKIDADGWWHTTWPAVDGKRPSTAQLFVDGQRRFRPRLPKTGHYFIERELPPSAKAAGKGYDRFGFAAEDLRPDWHNVGDVEVIPTHQWTMSRLRIAAVDPAEQTVTFTGSTPSLSYWSKLAKGHQYVVENVREALGSPGQWYLDSKSGELTYVPREGETPDTTEVILPRLSHLVLLRGEPAAGRFVSHVELHGLDFAHAHWATPPAGQALPQAEVNLDGAVSAVGARHVAIVGCAVRHVGTYGMAFGAGCRDNRVESCELVDLGAGGVKIGATGAATWADLRVAPGEDAAILRNTVRDCTIAHAGRLHSAGIGVWIGYASHNLIEHNDIFDLYYSSVSVGWSWGYAPSKANHNVIRANHMHTVGQGVLSDMGGVYTLGVSPGTVVELNRIHDVEAHGYGGWGLYTDEGSTGIVMRNNLVYRTKTGSFHQHYGKENRIENNILVNSRLHQIQRTRMEEHRSFTFQKNIVYWTTGPLLASNWKDNRYLFDFNCYWRASGDHTFDFAGTSLDAWRAKGQDQHSIVADPLFVDPANDDYRLEPDSPALKTGFVPFDTSKAGRLTDRTLTKDLPPVPAAFFPVK